MNEYIKRNQANYKFCWNSDPWLDLVNFLNARDYAGRPQTLAKFFQSCVLKTAFWPFWVPWPWLRRSIEQCSNLNCWNRTKMEPTGSVFIPLFFNVWQCRPLKTYAINDALKSKRSLMMMMMMIMVMMMMMICDLK